MWPTRSPRALGVGVAVIDANDIGVNVLGVSPGVRADVVASLLRDNPLGQASEQTPGRAAPPVAT